MNQKIIAIGAVGGSGTRVVAKIFMDAGVFVGDDLNAQNDNLTFTQLFKNPDWYNTELDVKSQKKVEATEQCATRF